MVNMTNQEVSSFATSKRIEEKFIVARSLLPLIRRELMPFVVPDPNGMDKGSYSVQSIYFDDLSHSSYFDKVDGNERRKKFRVRSYNFDPTQLRFETKNKLGKESWKVVTSVRDPYFKFSYQNLIELIDKLGDKVEQFKRLEPILVISYKRQGFILQSPIQNLRITIDEEIISSRNIFQLYKYRMGERVDQDVAIIEIKALPGLTPSWLMHIKKKLLIESSYSKYITAFNQLQIRS